MISCLTQSITIQHHNQNIDNQYTNIDNKNLMDIEQLADKLTHLHESLVQLKNKFGNDYEIISIRRNKYERFLSLWKHIVDELFRTKNTYIADIFSKLTINDVFDGITPNDIVNTDSRYEVINNFLDKLKISKNESYLINMLHILYAPILEWTNGDPNIIWFDIHNINELENWVSKKLGKNFKMQKVNSSQHFNCNIKINNEFKEKYDNIYNVFENRKLDKTLL
jgi:hypothetical protein